MDELLYQTEMEYTYDKYLKLSLFHVGKKRKFYIIQGFLLMFLIALGLFAAVFAILIEDTSLFYDALLLICFTPIFLILQVLANYLVKRRLKKNWETSRYLQEISFLRYEFYEDYMLQITCFGTLKFSYYLVNKVYENNEFFCFMLERNQNMIVEKAQCSDELIQFIREKVMKK